MKQWTAFGRWVRPVMAGLLVFAFTACASQPAAQSPGPSPKVQTFHELMVKLKKGFDEGTLDTPEFYAKELGYPLERAETLKVIPPPYTPAREIRFDSGELAGTVAYVGAGMAKDGRKLVSFRSANVIRLNLGTPCISLSDIQLIWGRVKPREPEAWGAHGPLPDAAYDYRTTVNKNESIAKFFASKADGCLRADFGVARYYD